LEACLHQEDLDQVGRVAGLRLSITTNRKGKRKHHLQRAQGAEHSSREVVDRWEETVAHQEASLEENQLLAGKADELFVCVKD
jgi:hypothetical protein